MNTRRPVLPSPPDVQHIPFTRLHKLTPRQVGERSPRRPHIIRPDNQTRAVQLPAAVHRQTGAGRGRGTVRRENQRRMRVPHVQPGTLPIIRRTGFPQIRIPAQQLTVRQILAPAALRHPPAVGDMGFDGRVQRRTVNPRLTATTNQQLHDASPFPLSARMSADESMYYYDDNMLPNIHHGEAS